MKSTFTTFMIIAILISFLFAAPVPALSVQDIMNAARAHETVDSPIPCPVSGSLPPIINRSSQVDSILLLRTVTPVPPVPAPSSGAIIPIPTRSIPATLPSKIIVPRPTLPKPTSSPALPVLPSQTSIRMIVGFPQSPTFDVRYPVIPDPDSVRGFIVMSPDLTKPKRSIPSEEEAVVYAGRVLAQYGGLPRDAVLAGVEQKYMEVFGASGRIAVQSIPIYSSVRYERILNGKDVVGGGGTIEINLGEQGELLSLYKIWHKLGSPVPVRVISAEEAFEDVKQGDVIRRSDSQCPQGVSITSVRLGYFEEEPGESQQYVEPVWIFSGTDACGGYTEIIVRAVEV
jgi:hypothetical protein